MSLTPRCPADPEKGEHLPVEEIDPPVHVTTVVAGSGKPGEQHFMGITRVCKRCWLYYLEPSMELLAREKVGATADPPRKQPRPS